MPDNFNQRVQGPYGDIYIVNTPHLDQLGKDLRNQEIYRQRKSDADARATDNEFAKNLAKVRDADIADIEKGYGSWKEARINLQKLGNKATTQDRMRALEKHAEVMRAINDSAKDRQDEELFLKDAITHPDNYNENAYKILRDRRKLPRTQMKGVVPRGITSNQGTAEYDLTDIHSLIKSPDDNTDYNKGVAAAMGKRRTLGAALLEDIDGGLTRKTSEAEGINHPNEILYNFKMMGDKWNSGLGKKMEYTPEAIQDKIYQYNQLRQTPEWKAAYPNDNSEIPQSMLQSRIGRAQVGKALDLIIENPPKFKKPTFSPIANKRDAAKNAEWDRRHNKVVEDRVVSNAKDAGQNVNNIYGKIEENQDNADINTTIDGKKIKAGRFNTLPNDAQQILMKSFKESGHDVTAEDIYQVRNPNGSISFYKTNDNGQPVPSEQLRIFTVSKVGTNLKAQPGVSEKREVVKQGEPGKEKYPLPKGKPRVVKQGKFTYEWDESIGDYK